MPQRESVVAMGQTVNEHCKHKDCIYRLSLNTTTQCCFYAVIEGRARRCKISECDKYRAGTRKANFTKKVFSWELDFDDNE